MNWTALNATELNWTEREWRGRAANTSILLIQSGHTFLQIILLIIPQRSIAALNQTELWVHSLCLWLSNPARLCDSHREHNLTPSILCLSPLSSSLFLALWTSASPRVNLPSLQNRSLPWFSLSLISIFYFSKFSRFSLSNSDWNYSLRASSFPCLSHIKQLSVNTVLLTDTQGFLKVSHSSQAAFIERIDLLISNDV